MFTKTLTPLPAVNAGSMADIAFLLLVFFLVTTSIENDLGLQTYLPPPDTAEPIEYPKQNVMVLLVNKNDAILANGEEIQLEQLHDKAKEFISNPTLSPDLPEQVLITTEYAQSKLTIAGSKGEPAQIKKWKDLLEAHALFGDFLYSKQVISLKDDRSTSYKRFIEVRNELAAAYNSLRNELALAHFNITYQAMMEQPERYYHELKAIKAVYPMRISEAEPNS